MHLSWVVKEQLCYFEGNTKQQNQFFMQKCYVMSAVIFM